MTEERQSGADSGLANVWDEICVQKQGDYSFYWDAYDETARQFALSEVTKLEPHEQAAIWLQTTEGEEWCYEDEDDREKDPVIHDTVVDYIVDEYLYAAASNWTNVRIRTFLEMY